LSFPPPVLQNPHAFGVGHLGSRVREECRRPDGEKHVGAGECTLCEEKAWANAESYSTNVVLPELAKLRSKTMGLDGKVVSPPWVRYHDNRSTWVSKMFVLTSMSSATGTLALHDI
jgi:hypothetical protein